MQPVRLIFPILTLVLLLVAVPLAVNGDWGLAAPGFLIALASAYVSVSIYRRTR